MLICREIMVMMCDINYAKLKHAAIILFLGPGHSAQSKSAKKAIAIDQLAAMLTTTETSCRTCLSV